jgi:hypothetical protein
VASFGSAHGGFAKHVAEPIGDDTTLFGRECLGVENKAPMAGTAIVGDPPREANISDSVEPFA